MTNRALTFTSDEMVKLREACRILGTSYAEFCHFAVMEAVSEVLGMGVELAQQKGRG